MIHPLNNLITQTPVIFLIRQQDQPLPFSLILRIILLTSLIKLSDFLPLPEIYQENDARETQNLYDQIQNPSTLALEEGGQFLEECKDNRAHLNQNGFYIHFDLPRDPTLPIGDEGQQWFFESHNRPQSPLGGLTPSLKSNTETTTDKSDLAAEPLVLNGLDHQK